MKKIIYLLALFVASSAVAQDDCNLQYDGNGDGAVNVQDVLGVLSEFGEVCEPGFVTCGDNISFDGYSYNSVQIGDQCWFQENLRSTHYANGDSIPGDATSSDWLYYAENGIGAQAIYYQANSLEDFGRLYNWWAVDDARGLCPNEWHVPSDEEFNALEIFLGMPVEEANNEYQRGTDHGIQMRSSLEDVPAWNGSNTSGFSALPAGYRHFGGSFYHEDDYAYFWTSTISEEQAWSRKVRGDVGGVHRHSCYPPGFCSPIGARGTGLSVRCIKD